MELKSLRRGDFWSGLALAALGAFIVARAREWEYLGAEGPGPGFFPTWYGIAMLALSLLLVAASLRDGSDPKPVNWSEVRNALAAWFVFASSVALFKLIGFVASYALLTFFIVAVMYRRPVRVAAAVAVLGAAGFYLVFPLALGVELPTGILGF